MKLDKFKKDLLDFLDNPSLEPHEILYTQRVLGLIEVAESATDIYQSLGNPDGWPRLYEALKKVEETI